MAKIHEILDSFVLYIFSCYLQFGIVCHGCLLSALKVRNERVRFFLFQLMILKKVSTPVYCYHQEAILILKWNLFFQLLSFYKQKKDVSSWRFAIYYVRYLV
ncbi:Uncharacterised protein [Escherichia coli]|nr:Uncharacterised protein [Escherichia coli]